MNIGVLKSMKFFTVEQNKLINMKLLNNYEIIFDTSFTKKR